MSDAHRSKRRRIRESAAQFLDLEAVVDHDDPSEGEENSDDEAFIVPEDLEDEDNGRPNHSRLLLSLTRADDEAPAAPPSALLQAHDRVTITDATERVVDIAGGPTLPGGIWEMRCRYGQEQAMVEHVESILQGQPPDLPRHTCVLAVNWTPQLRGRIFIEVADGPQARQEQDYLIASLDALVQPPFYQKQFLPFQGLTNWMKTWPHTRTAHTFARIRRYGCYRGDIAYIFPLNNTLWLAIVPRISLDPNFKGTRPARATITTRKIHLSRITDKTVNIHEENQYFVFQGERFTLEGYLLIAVDDIDLFPEINPTPTLDELARFKDLVEMPSHVRNDYLLGSLQKRMSVHNRIWITQGEYHGQVGFLQETRGVEADVYIPHEETVITVLLESLRGHFEIGDQVAVQYGTHKGTIGFVVRSENGKVTVANPLAQIEIETPLEYVFFWEMPLRVVPHTAPLFDIGDEVIVRSGPEDGLQGVVDAVHGDDIVIREGEFFPAEFQVPMNALRQLNVAISMGLPLRIGEEVQVTTGEHGGKGGSIIAVDAREFAIIREGPSQPNKYCMHSSNVRHTSIPKRNDLELAIREGNYDPYRVLVGKGCTVVAGPLKGYRGWVIATHPSGEITVRHEARLQETAKYPINLLAMHEEYPELQPPRIPSPVPVRVPTPLNLDVPERPLSPAWNPAASPPRLPAMEPPPEPVDALPPSWIQQPEFQSFKISLRDDFGKGRIGIFKGMQGDRVRVNFTSNTIDVLPMSFLRHVTPKAVDELVVPIEGEYKGKAMRVKEFGPVECTLAKYQKRNRSKKYVPPVIKTLHLAHAVPPS